MIEIIYNHPDRKNVRRNLRKNLTPQEKELLAKEGPLPFSVAERMIENVIGTMPLPYGLATNFTIDDKKYIDYFCHKKEYLSLKYFYLDFKQWFYSVFK